MFERIYSWTIRHGPQLLLAASVLMLIVGIEQFVPIMRSDFYYFGTNEHFFLSSVGPGVILLFGAVLTERLRRP